MLRPHREIIKNTSFDALCLTSNDWNKLCRTSTRSRFGQQMILIVEDDVATRRLYVDILLHEGIPCIATGNPEQALRWASSQRFDAVLLDLGLPRTADGLWLASRLRTLSDAPPIIVATGHFVQPEASRMFRATIHKPADAAEIVAVVRRAIGEQLNFEF